MAVEIKKKKQNKKKFGGGDTKWAYRAVETQNGRIRCKLTKSPLVLSYLKDL